MKRILIVGLIFLSQFLFAQQNKEQDSLTGNKVREIVRNQFSTLLGSSNGNIGSYASIVDQNGTLNLSTSFIHNKNIINVDVKGNSSDGISAIFTNSRLNTGFSLGVQYHLLSPKWDVSISGLKYNKYLNSLNKIENNFKQRREEINNDQNLGTLEKIEKNNENINNREKAISENDKLLSDNVLGFSLNWFTIGYKVKHNSFNLFDGQQSFDSQAKRENYVSHAVEGKFSWYHWKPLNSFETFFISTGLNFGISNNIADLGTVEITDTSTSTSGNVTRTAESKYNVFVGEYVEDIKETNAFFDGYWFPFYANKGAVHLNSNTQFSKEQKPIWSLTVGYLIPFKKKSEESSVVNIELFYQFRDLSNTLDVDLGAFERNIVGIRTSLPFNIK